MPSTLSGLAILAALLIPGFIYLERLESRQPAHEYTALRETGQVLVASLVSNGLVLALFALIRALAPTLTPDAGALVRGGGDFFRLHYGELTAWASAGLAVSCGIAAALAVPPKWYSKLTERLVDNPESALRRAAARGRLQPITHHSGWSAAFNLDPERFPYLGVTLHDGTNLAGPLLSFSSQADESGNRSVSLSSPLRIRYPAEQADQAFFGDVLVVAASDINFLTVSYLPDAPEPTPYHGTAAPNPAAGSVN